MVHSLPPVGPTTMPQHEVVFVVVPLGAVFTTVVSPVVVVLPVFSMGFAGACLAGATSRGEDPESAQAATIAARMHAATSRARFFRMGTGSPGCTSVDETGRGTAWRNAHEGRGARRKMYAVHPLNGKVLCSVVGRVSAAKGCEVRGRSRAVGGIR